MFNEPHLTSVEPRNQIVTYQSQYEITWHSTPKINPQELKDIITKHDTYQCNLLLIEFRGQQQFVAIPTKPK